MPGETHNAAGGNTQNCKQAFAAFFVSSEDTPNPDNIYWMTNDDMISLPHIAGGKGVALMVNDHSKEVENNPFNEYIISDIGYNQ